MDVERDTDLGLCRRRVNGLGQTGVNDIQAQKTSQLAGGVHLLQLSQDEFQAAFDLLESEFADGDLRHAMQTSHGHVAHDFTSMSVRL